MPSPLASGYGRFNTTNRLAEDNGYVAPNPIDALIPADPLALLGLSGPLPMGTATAPMGTATPAASSSARNAWAQNILNGLRSEVNQSLWSQVDNIADPYARLQALQPLMFRRDRERYGQLLQQFPEPADIPDPVAPTPTTPTTPAVDPAADTAAKRAAAIANARNRAQQQAELFIRSKGMDAAPWMAMLGTEFDRIQNTIGEDEDPSSAFSGNIIQSLMDGEEAKQYRQHKGLLDSEFETGFDKADMPSSLLDDVIGEILGKQTNDARQYLDRGKTRGMYNDVGYNAGLSAIDAATAAGRSELGSLGNTALDKYRGMGKSVRDKAYNALSGFDIGDQFSLDPYVSEYQGILADARNNAGGDLRGLLGGKNFFDLNSLTGTAGKAQGALNLRDADVATALTERKRKNSMSRGLGSQGAF